MSDKSKNSTASTPDQLVNSGISATVELSEQDMVGVSGGFLKYELKIDGINGYRATKID